MPLVFHKSRSSLLPDYVEVTGKADPYTQAELDEFEAAFPGFNSSDPKIEVAAWDAWQHARMRGWVNPATVAKNSSVTK